MQEPAVPFQAALTHAIGALGTPALARRLAELLATQVSADSTVIVSYQQTGAAIYLYDDLQHRRELLFQQYLNGIYAEDPFYRALRSGIPDGVYSLRALCTEQSGDPHYMAQFYQATGWQDELGIVLKVDSRQWLTLFLGRLQPSPFTLQEQQVLGTLVPLLRALCQQHWSRSKANLAQPAEQAPLLLQADMRARVERALSSFGQRRLTGREQQVAALLLQGHDNQAIAQQLAIGIGTVKNHRKHLYTKLQISSQSALFTHFINHLITQGEKSNF